METLTLEHVYFIGQTIAAVAVVLTLAYLAVQIKMSHNVASDTNRQQRAVGVREFALALANNDQLGKAWIKAEDSYSTYEQIAEKLALDHDEARRVAYSCIYWWWLLWAQWASIKTDSDLVELQDLIRGFYSNPPMSVVWETHPYIQILDKRFVQFVNDNVEKSKV